MTNRRGLTYRCECLNPVSARDGMCGMDGRCVELSDGANFQTTMHAAYWVWLFQPLKKGEGQGPNKCTGEVQRSWTFLNAKRGRKEVVITSRVGLHEGVSQRAEPWHRSHGPFHFAAC